MLEWPSMVALPAAGVVLVLVGRGSLRRIRREWWRVRMFRATGQWR